MAKKKLVLYENNGKRGYKFDLKAPKKIKERTPKKGIFSKSDTHTVKRIKLFKIQGLTEAKTFKHSTAVETPYGTFPMELPTAYVRKADKDIMLEIKVARDIFTHANEMMVKCAKKVMTTIIPDILAGKIDDANKAFSSHFKECLANRDWGDQEVEVNIYLCCSCSSWKRV